MQPHGPRCWLADDQREDRITELGWTVVPVDRFDLRPSGTRLKDALEKLPVARKAGIVTTSRPGEERLPAA